LREFQQLGFEVDLQIAPTVDADNFLDRFLLEAVEANGLFCGGGGGPTNWHFFVYGQERRSCSVGQREALLDWLREAGATELRAGSFEDAWWGPGGRPCH
jgi:uncharacterized protein YggL (DUF469 family)